MSTGVVSPTLGGFQLNVSQSAPSDLYGNGLVYSMAEPQLPPAINMNMAAPYGGLGKHCKDIILFTQSKLPQTCIWISVIPQKTWSNIPNLTMKS